MHNSIVENSQTNELGVRTLSGSLWLLLTKISLQLLSFLQIVILGRILDPNDFGLMGIALLAIQAFSVFTYTGYEYALVQKSDLTENDIHTAWWIMLFQRSLIGALLIIFSSTIASIFKSPQAIPILFSMALLQPIIGLSNPALSIMQRDLKFRNIFFFQFVPTLVSLITSITFVLLVRNVWTLVLGQYSFYIIQLFLSFLMVSYRPRIFISKGSVRYYFGYGSWMFGSAILWFVFTQGPNSFAGWMFGVASLGIYQMAAKFAQLPTSILIDVLQGSVFSAISLIQEDKYRITSAFLRILNISSVIIFGLVTTLAFGLPKIFLVLLGGKWIDAALLIPAIAISAGLITLIRVGSPLFLGTGKTKYQFYVDLTQMVVMMVLLFPLGKMFGLAGLPYATIAGSFAAIIIWWWGIKSITFCRLQDLTLALLPVLVGAVLIACVYYLGGRLYAPQENNYLIVVWQVLLIIISSTIYYTFIYLSQKVLPDYHPIDEIGLLMKKFKSGMRCDCSSFRLGQNRVI